MSEEEVLKISLSQDVATVTLNRPKVRNALNEELVVLLTQAFQKLSVTDAVRVIFLKGAGDLFCAGADLAWLLEIAAGDLEKRQRHGMQFAMALDAIYRCAKPVIAVVHGPTNGAGVGLTACAHIAIAPETASFTLPESRRGLSSAFLAPYLAEALGVRACQRYLITGESFSAQDALRIGLLHAIAPADGMAALEAGFIDNILKGAPATIAGSIDTLRVAARSEIGPDLLRWGVARFAEVLSSPEAQEGVASFTEKRKPNWTR